MLDRRFMRPVEPLLIAGRAEEREGGGSGDIESRQAAAATAIQKSGLEAPSYASIKISSLLQKPARG